MPYVLNGITHKAARLNMSVETLIETALDANGRNEFKAAVQLGVYPNALRYHMRRIQENKLRDRLEPLLATKKRNFWYIRRFFWTEGRITGLELGVKINRRPRLDIEPMVVAIDDAERFLPIVNSSDELDVTLTLDKQRAQK